MPEIPVPVQLPPVGLKVVKPVPHAPVPHAPEPVIVPPDRVPLDPQPVATIVCPPVAVHPLGTAVGLSVALKPQPLDPIPAPPPVTQESPEPQEPPVTLHETVGGIVTLALQLPVSDAAPADDVHEPPVPQAPPSVTTPVPL